MASRKKRPKLKSDAALQFLRGFLKRGPKPASEVQSAALDAGISLHMLAKVSQSIVTKAQKTEPDGTRKWCWELRTSQRHVRKSAATVRETAAEAAAAAETAKAVGYKMAVTEMLRRLAFIVGEKGKRLTAKQLIARFDAELHSMKGKD